MHFWNYYLQIFVEILTKHDYGDHGVKAAIKPRLQKMRAVDPVLDKSQSI